MLNVDKSGLTDTVRPGTPSDTASLQSNCSVNWWDCKLAGVAPSFVNYSEKYC
jgi:hypothetical protein